MSKVAIFAFTGLAAAQSWQDPFTTESLFEFTDIPSESVCTDCNTTVEDGAERYLWGQSLVECGTNFGRIQCNVGNQEMDWTPASNCLDRFEIMWSYATGFDFTNDGNDDAIVSTFGLADWNFRLADYTMIACNSDCDSLGGIGALSLSMADGLSVAPIPATCARYSRNMGSDFAQSDTALYTDFVGHESIDFSSVMCFVVGTEQKLVGSTMTIATLTSADTFTTTTTTVTASLIGDPHLSGFHGERVELTDSEPTFYSIYCDASNMVNIRTEPSPSGASYISNILFNVNGVVSEFSVDSMKKMRHQKVTVEVGDLSFDVRRSVDANVAFLDIAISADAVSQAGGIIGRTLAKTLSSAEMNVVAPFVVSSEQHSLSHSCQF